jgi:hypothetical protein
MQTLFAMVFALAVQSSLIHTRSIARRAGMIRDCAQGSAHIRNEDALRGLTGTPMPNELTET